MLLHRRPAADTISCQWVLVKGKSCPPHASGGCRHCDALPIDTFLRPNYYELFPLFSGDALERRAEGYSFAEATLLSPANIKTLIANERFRGALAEFVAKPFSWQKEALGSALMLAGITDDVVEAIGTVDRHLFVMPPYQPLSYLNAFLPWSQTAGLSPPGLVATMLERFKPEHDRAYCEIGAGSGYHLACLYELTRRTTTLRGYEIDNAFADHGRRSLHRAGYPEIELNSANALNVTKDVFFDGVYATAAGSDLEGVRRMCGGGEDARYQWLRPLLLAEFDSEPPESWLKRSYRSHQEYLESGWTRSFGCLSTGTMTSDLAAETDVLYEVSLVLLEDRQAPVGERPRADRSRRIVDDLLDALGEMG